MNKVRSEQPSGLGGYHSLRWLVFFLCWFLSIAVVVLAEPSTALWRSAVFVLTVALFVSIRKYLAYRRELLFLREFHHLSQTLDDLRDLRGRAPYLGVLDSVVRIVGFDRAILYLYDEDVDGVKAVAAINYGDPDDDSATGGGPSRKSDLKNPFIKESDGPCLAWQLLESSAPAAALLPRPISPSDFKLVGMLDPELCVVIPISRGGNIYGLVLVDRHLSRKPVTDDDLLQLQVLADQISISVQNQTLHDELARRAALLGIQSEKVHRELVLAKIVQDGVLPRSSPNWSGVHFNSFLKPASFIGGDFFRYIEGCRAASHRCEERRCEERRCEGCPRHMNGILVGDVSGKGIPAALVMAVVNCLFHEKTKVMSDPARIMQEVNKSMKTYLGAESRFNCSAFLGFYLPAASKFIYANAGHDFPLFYCAATGMVTPLESTGTLLGIFHESNYSCRDIDISPGDRILFYTDGLTDLLGQRTGSEDGYEVLSELFRTGATQDPDEFMIRLGSGAETSTTSAPDDITAVLMTVRAPDPQPNDSPDAEA